MTLAELEGKPEFAKLPYSDQVQIRGRWFERELATKPEFAALPDTDKVRIFESAAYRMPVVEIKESNYLRGAQAAVQKMQAGDASGIEDAIAMSSTRTGTKQMLLPTLAAQGIDAIGRMLDPDVRDPLYADYYGRDGENIDQWLQMNVSKYGGEAAMKRLGGATFAKGAVGSFAEFALMTLGLGAVGSVIGGAGGAAGAARGASIGRGLLTGEHLSSLTQLAMSGAGKLSAPLIRNLTALTVEGVTSGVTQTGLDLLRLGLQDELVNKSKSEVWDTIARSYGANVAMNYVGWGVMKAAGTVLKAGVKAVRGVELDPVKNFLEAFDYEANPAAKASSREYVLSTLGPNLGRLKIAEIDPKSELGFGVYSQAHGWDAKFDTSGHVTLTSIENPKLVLPNMPRKQAAYRIAEIASTGQPAVTLKPGELTTSGKGLAAVADNSSRLLQKTTYKVNGALDPGQIRQMLWPTEGKVNPDQMTLFGKSYLKSRGVPSEIAEGLMINLDTQLPGSGRRASSGMTVTVDPRVHVTGDEASLVEVFMRDLDNIVERNKADTTKAQINGPVRFMPPPLEANHASVSAVEAAARKLGIPIDVRNTHITLGEGPLAREFTSAREANAAVIQMAYDAGKLSDDQVASIIGQRNGLTLEKVAKPVMSESGAGQRLSQRKKGDATMTYAEYVVYKPVDGGKKQIAAAPDLDTLFRQHPELDPRLPSTLAPEIWSVDPKAGTVSIEQTIVTGSGVQLHELAGKFTSPMSAKPLLVTRDGVIEKLPGKSTYVLRNDNLGVVAEFASPESAKKWLAKANSQVQMVREAFSVRDMRIEHMPDGTLVGVAADGSTKQFASLVAAEKWLQNTPYAPWMKELLPVPETLINEADEQIGGLASKLLLAVPDKKLLPGVKPSKLVNAAAAWGAPTEMALNIAKQQHGQGRLLEFFHQMRQGFRTVQGLDNKVDSQVTAMFKRVKYDDKVMYGVLLGNDPSKWDEIAERGFKRQLVEADRVKLAEMADFYDVAFTAAGLPDWKRVYNYMPRIRDYARLNPDDILDSMTASDYLTKVFGTQPMGFDFFGDKARASELLKLANFEDAEQVMRTYAYALNKHTVMDGLLRNIRTELTTLEGKYPKTDLHIFQGALDEMQSVAKTEQTKLFKLQSKQVVVGIQSLMQKIPGLRGMPIANAPVVGDIIDMMNSRMTVATQAKPWATFRNMAQISLLGAALGDNKVMWEAFGAIINEADDVTIKRLLKTGAVTGAGFIHAAPGSQLSLWRSLMKWNENMDVITRATAFKASEMQLEKWWPQVKNGQLDVDTFVKRSGLTILDDGTRQQVLNALNQGDMSFAADQFGDALNRMCFFDYSKMNKAGFQRGLIGKVFGKFGTYPAGTLALYHRILTTGSVAERTARMGRMVFTSLAIYHGARAMGIDYKGFLWTDPFGFQGGPLWHLMADGSQFIGDSSQAKQARASMIRNLPRLMSPTINTYQQAQRALERLNNDDLLGAAITLSGAPARKDAEWLAMTRGY